jgi:hypothetical protein
MQGLEQLPRIPLLGRSVNRGKGLYKEYNASMSTGPERGFNRQMAESQLSELQNMRVLLEEARGLSRNLSYEALEEVDRQIVELRAAKG